MLTRTVPCEWGPHHASQGNASCAIQHSQGAGLAASAGAEGVRHDWADEEGDGEGGCSDPPCGHEGDDAEDEQQAGRTSCGLNMGCPGGGVV